MHTTQVVSAVVASGTWIGFGIAMRSYFRHADRRTTAKTLLIVAACACTAVQLACIAAARPPAGAWLWLGVAAYGLANGLFWWALSAHGKAHPAFAFIRVPPSTLTTAGPYCLVRHPIYAAYLLAWCAGAAIVARPWLLAGAGCMAFFYLYAARQEERGFLTSPLASRYGQYRQRTGMFLPRLTALLPTH